MKTNININSSINSNNIESKIVAPHSAVRSVALGDIIVKPSKRKNGRSYSRLKGERPKTHMEKSTRFQRMREKTAIENRESSSAVGRAEREKQKGRFIVKIKKDGTVVFQDNTKGFGKMQVISTSLALKMGLVTHGNDGKLVLVG